MVWKADAPQMHESMKMLWELVPYTKGHGLDLGCGPSKTFPHFVGVDNRKDTQMFGIQMNPDHTVPTCENMPFFASEQWDFVFSSHLLEHIEDHVAALKEWWRLIKVGGHLCLYLPHKKYYPNIGEKGANKDHKHDFMPAEIITEMLKLGDLDVVRSEDRNENEEYSFFQVFKKLPVGAGQHFSYKKPKPKKTCAVVRYGAWGDALQMTSILPGLKKQGYHITLYTTERCQEVIKDDPNVDAWIVQGHEQVPNMALRAFWDWEQKKYDKWVNLSESIEAHALALDDRTQGRWPKSVREKYMNMNYWEFTHDIAEVPYEKPLTKFYATLEEKNWAFEEKAKIGGDLLILWVLNGSSVHKVWPHLDQIFARLLLTYPGVRIVTIGDPNTCMMLDEPWKNEPRVKRMAGKWTIRQTLAMADISEVVVGPETGVLSSVCMQPMPKIVFLSHSTHENLTRDWLNTFALFSTKTKCYPCHKLHYTWDTCNQAKDKNAYWDGAAQCQVDLPPEACWAAVMKAVAPLVEEGKVEIADLDNLAMIPSRKQAIIPILPHAPSPQQLAPAGEPA